MIQFTLMMLPMLRMIKRIKSQVKLLGVGLRTHFRVKEKILCLSKERRKKKDEKYQAHKLLINNSNGELHCIRYGARVDDKNQFIKVLNSNVQLHNISPDYAF